MSPIHIYYFQCARRLKKKVSVFNLCSSCLNSPNLFCEGKANKTNQKNIAERDQQIHYVVGVMEDAENGELEKTVSASEASRAKISCI